MWDTQGSLSALQMCLGAVCSGHSVLCSTPAAHLLPPLGSPEGHDGRLWESSWPKSWCEVSAEHRAGSRPRVLQVGGGGGEVTAECWRKEQGGLRSGVEGQAMGVGTLTGYRACALGTFEDAWLGL